MGLFNIFKPLSTFILSVLLIHLSNIDHFSTEIFLGNAGNQTQGCWVRSKYATSVLCSPIQQLKLFRKAAFTWSVSPLSSSPTVELSPSPQVRGSCLQWARPGINLMQKFANSKNIFCCRNNINDVTIKKTFLLMHAEMMWWPSNIEKPILGTYVFWVQTKGYKWCCCI